MTGDRVAEADVRAAIAGELQLLKRSVRQDAEKVDVLLHPDFFEFGASGRRWDRREIMEMMAAEPALSSEDPGVAVSDMAGLRLADNVVLVTYTSHDRQRRCRRSSIWVRTGAEWHVLFHQGTVIPPG